MGNTAMETESMEQSGVESEPAPSHSRVSHLRSLRDAAQPSDSTPIGPKTRPQRSMHPDFSRQRRPRRTVQRAVLLGLAQMPRVDILEGIQVGDRARHLQNPVACAGRKPQRVITFSSNFSPFADVAHTWRIIFGTSGAFASVFFSVL
jgi:hypothetical protein